MKLPSTMHVLERGWLSSNNIVFIDKERTAVVDTGYCTHGEQTLQLIQALLGERPLDAIYNTLQRSRIGAHQGASRSSDRKLPL